MAHDPVSRIIAPNNNIILLSDEGGRGALRGLAGLLDQLDRAVSGNVVAAGPHPVQCKTLRYFTGFGPRALSGSGLAKFQGIQSPAMRGKTISEPIERLRGVHAISPGVP